MRTHGVEVFYFGDMVWRRGGDGFFRAAFSSLHLPFHHMLFESNYRRSEEGLEWRVRHRDGDKDNNQPSNLVGERVDANTAHGAWWRNSTLPYTDALELLEFRRDRFARGVRAEEEAALDTGAGVEAVRRRGLVMALVQERDRLLAFPGSETAAGEPWFGKYIPKGSALLVERLLAARDKMP